MDDYYYGDQDMAYSGSRKMATAALILSFIAVTMFYIFFLSIPMAAIALILAILSKGSGKLHHRGKLAILAACGVIVISTFNIGASIYRIYSDPELRQEFTDRIKLIQDVYLETDVSYSLEELFPALQEPSSPTPNSAPSMPDTLIEGGEQI